MSDWYTLATKYEVEKKEKENSNTLAAVFSKFQNQAKTQPEISLLDSIFRRHKFFRKFQEQRIASERGKKRRRNLLPLMVLSS